MVPRCMDNSVRLCNLESHSAYPLVRTYEHVLTFDVLCRMIRWKTYGALCGSSTGPRGLPCILPVVLASFFLVHYGVHSWVHLGVDSCAGVCVGFGVEFGVDFCVDFGVDFS